MCWGELRLLGSFADPAEHLTPAFGNILMDPLMPTVSTQLSDRSTTGQGFLFAQRTEPRPVSRITRRLQQWKIGGASGLSPNQGVPDLIHPVPRPLTMEAPGKVH